MDQKGKLKTITQLVHILEICLSLLLIIGIIVSIPDLIKYFIAIISSSKGESYILVQEFLSHVLLLVIGLEFTLMMLAHSDTAVIYLMVMVISRKMLIYGESTKDLFIGSCALMILFFIKKYLINTRTQTMTKAGIFSAATRIDSLNSRFGYKIEDMGFQTIGGLVYFLLKQQDSEIATGAIVSGRDYIFEVEEAEEGLIESVYIEKK